MRAKLRVVLASKFTQLDEEITRVDSQLNTISEEMRAQGETVQQLDAEHSERTQRGYAIDNELRENRERMSSIAMEIDRS